MALVKRTERGWPAHFIFASRCVFHRNTFLECGDNRIVVSSVGHMEAWDKNQNVHKVETIGYNRYYETMVFNVKKETFEGYEDYYWDADTYNSVEFESPWAISDFIFTSDMRANDMHDAVVDEMAKRMESGETFNQR